MTVYGYTIEVDERGAVTSLKALESQGKKTTDVMEQTATSTKKVEDRTDQLGQRAGKTASAMGMLGGVLGRIDPALEDAARGVADVADSLDAATMFGSSLFRVLGPVGVALAGLGAAYVVLNQQLEAANERMAEQAQRAEDMAELHNKVKEAALLASLAENEITQERFNQIVASRTAADLFSEMRSERQSALMDAANELELEKERLQTLQTFIDTQRQQLGEAELQRQFPLEIQDLQNQIATVELLENARARAARQLGQVANAEFEYSQNLETVANSQNEVTEAVKTGTDAIKEMTDQVLTLGEAFRSLGLGDPGGVGIGIDLADPMSARLEPMREGLDLLQRQIEVRQRLQALEGDQFANVAGKIASGVQVAGGNLSGVAGLLPSGMAGLAGALGPIGAIAGGLSAIGRMGSEGVEQKLDDLLDSIVLGLQSLPEILIDVIPNFVAALVTELPIAIARALFEVISTIVEGARGTGQPPTTQEILDRPFGIFQLGLIVGGGEKGITTPDPTANSRSAAATTRGRLVRADGARRLAMTRAPTSTMFGSGPTVIQQALGFDSGTQDRFQRKFSQLTNAETGLRGRT